ncbi:E3 ubiquitin-protein ligase Topors-like [Mugil cephalus]|uniref:E3 ubiquitin-protein ligase Topors-like n=1 Tax=Mugil cephalus TaxID=48193 RepID=UPI001FB6AB5B|nr:E3 ubiquitin-protein ligase Topors-like [Mugil cephalus]
MPLTARSSARRKRKTPDEKLPERPEESTSTQVMAPTRMKLRVRRRDAAAAANGGGGPPEEEEERNQDSQRKSGSRTSAAASSSASASARAVMAAEEASPDSKCPICLDRFNNLAYLDRCLHRFCFPCIQEWSHNKAECPLCKQPFASILHSVRAEDDFKEYTLRPAPGNSSVAATVAMVAAMASAARSDHQMRLMLRRHRVADGETATNTRRRRRERGGQAEERAGVWEWYLDSPPLPPLPHPPVEDGEEHRRLRGDADVAERGVVFEAHVAPNDRPARRLMMRLAARQRRQREGGVVRHLRERETVAFRRALYRCGVRVRGVAGTTGNQQQRDITADGFRRSPSHLNRLRPWLRRELTVLYGVHGSLVDIVQRIITSRLARYGLEEPTTIEEELRPFLLARTEHFVHELVSFARSPLAMDAYDLHAVYEPPPTAAAMELDGASSSSESSSVIAISEGEEEEVRAEAGGAEVGLLGGAGGADDVIQMGSSLSLASWDDETPGPSYSTAEPSNSLLLSPAPPETANEEEAEDEGEECLIVGYKKPIAERTPELVQLSSDTEEEEEEKTHEKPLPVSPAGPAPSHLPTAPPSTSGASRAEQDDGPKDKDGEGWSRSSSRSGNSVSVLSPAAPGEEVAKEEKRRRRRKKKRRGQERKSGTLYNPNRSIYPAMMHRRRSHSPSPFHSSTDSRSPDYSWDYPCSQISPFTTSSSSSSSSSCSSSSSPLCSSSPPPPTPSPSPSDRSIGEKPGGKRKYKSRHLDNDVKDPTWRPSSSQDRERRRRRRRRRKGREEGGGRKERRRRDDRRERARRSPSVEIVYEGTTDATQPPAHKRRRKRRRRVQHSSPPVIITLDSDGSDEDVKLSASSSPLSSQQTVDFSDLPPLHSARLAAAMDADIGELPVDILDRRSDGSEAEAEADATEEEAAEVDVTQVETVPNVGAVSSDRRGPAGTRDDLRDGNSDRLLLASILSDLKDISVPRHLTPSRGRQDNWLTLSNEDRDRSPKTGPCSSPSPSVLGGQDVDRDRDVPPLLRQASPVTSYDRNTPPPLKHKDAGSPQPSPVSPRSVSNSWLEDAVPPPVPTLRTPGPLLHPDLNSFHSSPGVSVDSPSGQRSPPADPPPAETPPHTCSTSRGQGVTSTDSPPSPPHGEERTSTTLTAAPSGRSSPAEMHPGKSSVELHPPRVASGGQTDRRTLPGWDRHFNHCDPDSPPTLTGTPPLPSHLTPSLSTAAPTQTHSQHV